MARRQFADGGRKQQRVAVRQEPDRAYDLVGASPLEQKSGGAGAEGIEHVVVVLEGGEDEDPRRVVHVGEQAPGGLDTVDDGHADVHQHDVGSQTAHERRHGGSVLGLADHGEVGLGVDDRS